MAAKVVHWIQTSNQIISSFGTILHQNNSRTHLKNLTVDSDWFWLQEQEDGEHDHNDDLIENPDPHFDPIVNLPPVQTKTLEEDEEEMVKLWVCYVYFISYICF